MPIYKIFLTGKLEAPDIFDAAEQVKDLTANFHELKEVDVYNISEDEFDVPEITQG